MLFLMQLMSATALLFASSHQVNQNSVFNTVRSFIVAVLRAFARLAAAMTLAATTSSANLRAMVRRREICKWSGIGAWFALLEARARGVPAPARDLSYIAPGASPCRDVRADRARVRRV
jgi:hypothetical protein